MPIGPANPTWAIFLVSVLGLFLEMLLIRWIGTEVRIFAYLQNTILVVCFLGLGLGCFTSRQPINLRDMLLPLCFLVLLFAVPITRQSFMKTSEFLSVLSDFLIWSQALSSGALQTMVFVTLGLGLTYCLMILILDMFVPIGRLLGRLMDEHPKTIWAYSVNIGGSLVGTWLFVLLSVFYQPPVVWFVILGGLTLFFLSRKDPQYYFKLILIIGLVGLSWFAGREAGSLEVVWSPYQKLVLYDADRHKDMIKLGKYIITVNNTGYQGLIDLNRPDLHKAPELFPPEMQGYSQYDLPLLLHPRPRSYLIVGAGSGNDAAGGLRQGVKQITAVEIDPAIISLGQRYHPENPYASPSVRLINDDARSFFATCQKRFDVISFGLLDAHTTTAMTNARLDHYVYTRESIARAKSLLPDGGIMTLTFVPQKRYIADRLGRVLQEVFGREPLYFPIPTSGYGWGGLMFVAGDLEAVNAQIAKQPKVAALIARFKRDYPIQLPLTTPVATDDWPYLYLEKAHVPILFYLLAGLMVLLIIRSLKVWQAQTLIRRWRRAHWHFFFLGAAFLLLEVQNISKAAVALGSTWQVNAVIVSGVLVMILLANLLAYRFPRLPLGWVYLALIGTCLALYFVDLARFAFLPYSSKAVVVGGLTTLPMLFSGIVFIRSFAAVTGKDEALGANLLGALVGALLQSATFVTGIKALLLIVALLYVISFLTRPAFAGPETAADQTSSA
jgi:spermidine synthase